jgi:hypothetical protein
MAVKCLQLAAGLRPVKKLLNLPNYGGCRPTRRDGRKKVYKLLPPFGRLTILKICRPLAGYKACNMLATYGWRSMVKLVEFG